MMECSLKSLSEAMQRVKDDGMKSKIIIGCNAEGKGMME